MRTVVLGAGALGSILAANLARAGQDVALIARGPRALLLTEHGVTVSGLAEFTAMVPIIERPADLGECDVFVLTAKTYDTQAALESVRNLKAGMAMSVQNGVIKEERLAEVFGQEHTVGCIANFSGEVTDDGAVRFTRNQGLYFGELAGGASSRTEEFARVLNDAGIKTIASDRIRSVEWSKYAAWMGLTAVAVLSRLYTHLVFRDEGLNTLQTELTREAVSLATVLDVDVMDLGELLLPKTLSESEIDDCVAVLKRTGVGLEASGTLTHRMSALQDLLRGRRLEIEETFGHAVRLGAELGVSTPRLEVCYRLLAAIDRDAGA